MILILSTARIEYTTDDVMDWLNRFGAQALRINGEDLDGESDLCFSLRQDRVETKLDYRGISLNIDEVTVVWWRR